MGYSPNVTVKNDEIKEVEVLSRLAGFLAGPNMFASNTSAYIDVCRSICSMWLWLFLWVVSRYRTVVSNFLICVSVSSAPVTSLVLRSEMGTEMNL